MYVVQLTYDRFEDCLLAHPINLARLIINRISIAVLFVLMVFTSSFLTAQAGKIPPFQIMQANGKVFKAENLPIGKPVILIYFSPDCSHCQQFMEAFFKQATKFEKASIAMVTFVPLSEVSKFSKQYNLVKYANIFAGTEGNTFFIKNYYHLIEMPFVALYTRNGDFIQSYVKEIDLKDVAFKLNELR